MNVAHVDFEIFSKLNLKDVGVYRYAEHPSTEIQVVGYAINDGKPKLWIPWNPSTHIKTEILTAVGALIYWGPECPVDLKHADQYRAFNAQFERVIGNANAGQKIGFPKTNIDDWVCVAAKAAIHNLPRKLSDCCEALDTTHQKDETGRNAMLKLAKVRKPTKKDDRTRWTYDNGLKYYIALYRYNIDDVLAERDIDDMLPDLPDGERIAVVPVYSVT